MIKEITPLGEAIDSFMQVKAVSWYRLAMLSGVNDLSALLGRLIQMSAI